MDYQNKSFRRSCDDAVSPVVGIMLMLVVTIIIAAVVSGFAGGLMGDQEKAPTLAMDVSIKNTGVYGSSTFAANVISVSEPIATRDLKLVTIWTTGGGDNGGATVTKLPNVFGWNGGGFGDEGIAPWGYGPGVVSSNSGKPNDAEQQFGNYTLLGGTTMLAYPAGQSGGFITSAGDSGYGVGNDMGKYTDWEYVKGETVDGMQAVLGENWEKLQAGDIVNVKVVHIPSGSTIFNKDVVVS